MSKNVLKYVNNYLFLKKYYSFFLGDYNSLDIVLDFTYL